MRFGRDLILVFAKKDNLVDAEDFAADRLQSVDHQMLLPVGLFNDSAVCLTGFHHLMEHRFKGRGKRIKVVCCVTWILHRAIDRD